MCHVMSTVMCQDIVMEHIDISGSLLICVFSFPLAWVIMGFLHREKFEKKLKLDQVSFLTWSKASSSLHYTEASPRKKRLSFVMIKAKQKAYLAF